METFREFRAAAASCRLLADRMGNADEANRLMMLATEFDALAEADEAARSASNADRDPPIG